VLILSPADRPEEVAPLAEAGAEELYAGFVPSFWSETFGPVVTSNRRSYEAAQVRSDRDLDELILAAQARGLPVYVTLNATPVPDDLLAPLVEFAADLARRGVRGLVVSDLGLLCALREARIRGLALHASTLFSAFNGAAVAFLRRAGASRVILARELSVAEIAAVAKKAKGVRIEAIVMRGRCPHVEGFCTHLHDDPDLRWPCELPYEKTWRGRGAGIPPQVEEALARQEGVDRYHSCGLCAVPLLERAGVGAVKIVGRGAETARKVEAVRAVEAMRAWGRAENPGAAECARRGKKIYRELFGRPCGVQDCYFPEFGPGAVPGG